MISAEQAKRHVTINASATKGPIQPLEPLTCDPGVLAPDDVETAVEACGLCHSDVSVMNGRFILLQTGSRICLRRLLSNRASGTKRRKRLVWRAIFPAA